MKTALQELVEEMEQNPLMFAPALALIKEKNFLETEKWVMHRVYIDSFVNSNGNTLSYDFEEYYNEIFNTTDND